PCDTGKTFGGHTLYHYFRSKGKFVLCAASSEIATLLLPGGKTLHFRYLSIKHPIPHSTYQRKGVLLNFSVKVASSYEMRSQCNISIVLKQWLALYKT
ncbi:hypothetical protein BDF20DRAFT_829010, partial [Mycotypha africana]|uniref:uncharacterized protein n=1 Tax=Mycotypha africana TaxID=64632 RepID=UPI00230159F6